MTDVIIHMTAGNRGSTEAGFRTLFGINYGSVDSNSVFGYTLGDFFSGGGYSLAVSFLGAGVDIHSVFDTVTFTNDLGPPVTYSSTSFITQFSGGPTYGTIGNTYTAWFTPGSIYTITFSKATLPTIVQAAPAFLEGIGVELTWTPAVGAGSDAGIFESFAVYRDGVQIVAGLGASVVGYVDQTVLAATSYTYEIRGVYSVLADSPVISNDQTIVTGSMEPVFNCDCEAVSTFATLADLRLRMLIQLGYASTAENPPGGMVAYCNEYLRNAQTMLFNKYKALRTERFFKWQMIPGQRYYGLVDNDDTCAVKLDPERVTWVGFEDLNKAWYQLLAGIDPIYYTRANINFGWPTRYEIRSCIEIFPAPQAPYTLWVKGHFGLAPFAADSDHATIDDELVLMFAVANAKSDRGKPDATRCMNQATARLRDLTAANHITRRYVPGTSLDTPATPPKFLPLGDQQS